MCEYCEEKGNRKRAYLFNSPILSLQIKKNNELYSFEFLSYNHKAEIVHNYKIIKFCPMCGRKLGDKDK